MVMQILEGLNLRRPTMEDAEQVAELANVCSMHDRGMPHMTADELRGEWQMPNFNLETDTWIVADIDGKIIGYVEAINVLAPHVRVWAWARVHPEHRNKGIGTHLMRVAEERARETILKAPPEARVYIATGTINTNEDAKSLFLNEGYTYTRSFYTMQIDMSEAPPAPQWSEGITVRTAIRGQDEEAIHKALNVGFADHWGFIPYNFELFKHFIENELKENYDPSLWFLAMDGDQIAGVSLCLPKTSEDPDRGWVEDLTVLRPWRRKGVALAMLHHSFGEFYRRGIYKVGLGVDASSLTGATKLYEKAGMRPVQVYDRYEKTLRPGVELTVQSLAE